jgi:hypothetical protein
MKEILNYEFASVYYDETSNSIISVWKKPTTSESYRAFFEVLLSKIRLYGAEAFISDIFYQGLVPTENRMWLQTEILPQAYNAGVRKVGIVAPGDVFSRFYIESVKNGAQAYATDLELCYFLDLISAQAWLLNKELIA